MRNNLDNDVLVLNSNWQWIGMTTVREAFRKLCSSDDGEAALIVDENYATHDLESWIKQPIDKEYVQTPHIMIAVPQIIIMRNYKHVPTQTIRWTRIRVLKRDRFTCVYCGAQPGVSSLTIDHIMPQSRGGTSTWQNTVASCGPCNARKANRMPKEAGMVLRKIPRSPEEELNNTIQLGQTKEIWKPFIKIKS